MAPSVAIEFIHSWSLERPAYPLQSLLLRASMVACDRALHRSPGHLNAGKMLHRSRLSNSEKPNWKLCPVEPGSDGAKALSVLVVE